MTKTKNNHDIGILLVHGIGEQPRHDTLIRFGEPIVNWLRELCLQPKSAIDFSAEQCDIQVTNKTELAINTNYYVPDSFRVHIKKKYDPAIDDDDIDPTHMQEEVWMVAETWWADIFSKPKFLKLAKWVFSIGPLLAVNHADRKSRIKDYSLPRRLWRIMYHALIAFIVQLITVLLVVLSIIPVKKWRNAIANVLSLLTATLGDAYVLVSSPVQEAAAIRRVLDGIDYLKEECEKIVVIAHSQGAAIAAKALAISKNDEVELFISFGAGISKLELLSMYHHPKTNVQYGPLTKLTRVITPLFFMTILLYPTLLPYIYNLHFSIITYMVFIMVLMGLFIFRCMHEYNIKDRIEYLKEEISNEPAYTKWMNIFALRDLVPNGSLCKMNSDSETEEGKFSEHEVRNFGKFTTDHTAYWDNKDEFVSKVVNAIHGISNKKMLSCTGYMEPPKEQYEEVRKNRKKRLLPLKVNGWVTNISAILFLWLFGPDIYNYIELSYSSVTNSQAGDPSLLFILVTWIKDIVSAVFGYYGLSDDAQRIITLSLATFIVVYVILLFYKKLYFMLWREHDEDYSCQYYKRIVSGDNVNQKMKMLWGLSVLPLVVGSIGVISLYYTGTKTIVIQLLDWLAVVILVMFAIGFVRVIIQTSKARRLRQMRNRDWMDEVNKY